MNKESVIQWLSEYFGAFFKHPSFLLDLADIISGSGYESKLFKIILIRLYQLSQFDLHAVNLEEFEPLGGGLYSLHCSGKGFNIRIIYAFLSSGEPVFLHAFYERGGKRKTDYTKPIKTAELRFNEMKGE